MRATDMPPRLGVDAESSPRAVRCAAIALAAAALAYDPAAHAADPKRVAILLVAAAALAGWRRGGVHTLPPGALAWFAFVALSALMMWVRQTPGDADLATYVGAATLLAAASLRPRDEIAATARLTALLIGAGAAAWALAQALARARGLGIHGGQGNPNWLGLLLAVTLPLSLSAAARARARGRAVFVAAVAGVVAQLAALVLAQSRTAVVALVAAGVASVIAHPAASRAGRSLAIGTAAAMVGIAALLVHAGALASLAGRLWIWRLSARAAADALPWGDGLGRFPAAFLGEQGHALAALPASEAARQFVNATTAHNDWLQTAVETGLPGVLALGAALVLGFRACRRSGALAEAATIVSFAIAAVADSPMRQPAILVLLVLALASAPRRASAPAAAAPARGTHALRACGLLAAAAVLPLATSAWLGARLATHARDAGPDQQFALLSRAAEIDPRSGEIAFALAMAELERAAPQAAALDLRKSGALLPQVATDVALGNALLAAGDADNAAIAYERALALNPGSFRAHVNLVVALRRLGRDDEADWHLRIARRLLPGHPALREL